jgi:tripartite-type tricarboxylate transporter receptor subunit TctC
MQRLAASVACLLAGLSQAAGQQAVGQTGQVPAPAATDFAGRTVRMVIGSAPGGTYDLLGRAVSRHIGRHLPGNPSVVPQNMPGAGGLVAANYVFNLAPKDGTVIAISNKGIAGAAVAGIAAARFDATRMAWLGTPITETSVCFAYNSPRLQVHTLDQLYERELHVGTLGAGTVSTAYPRALTALLGLKFMEVGGYTGTNQIYLAMERGEVEALCEGIDGVIAKRPTWIPENVVTLLLQGGATRNPDLPNVPFIIDRAKNSDDRLALEFLYAAEGIGRPFFAPPDLPPAVLAMVRGAFDKTMQDAAFIADAKKLGFDPRPENSAYLTALIGRMAATPQPIKDKVVALTK